jgi:hypothetical protein
MRQREFLGALGAERRHGCWLIDGTLNIRRAPFPSDQLPEVQPYEQDDDAPGSPFE